MKKLILLFLMLIFSAAGLIVCHYPDQQTHLIFCDVGQGDAVLLSRGFFQLLVDGGSDESVLECLAEQLPFWDQQIELVVITHMDDDHIGGLVSVFKNYHVQQLLTTNFIKNSDTFWSLREQIERSLDSGLIIKQPILGRLMSLTQGVELLAIFPRVEADGFESIWTDFSETRLSDAATKIESKIDDYNDRSIVVYVVIDGVRVLLTGDLSEHQELALINQGLITAVEILKIGHHGSKTSTSLELMTAARPEISVISVGEGNQYQHPSSLILDRLITFDTEILRTDKIGSIELVIDEEKGVKLKN